MMMPTPVQTLSPTVSGRSTTTPPRRWSFPRKRRREVAELLEALLQKHPIGTVYVVWDNSNTHKYEEIEEVLRGASRLVLLYLPTYSPSWLNPLEVLWRYFRREVPHCEFSRASRLWSRRPTISSSAITEDLVRFSNHQLPRHKNKLIVLRVG
jgi:transposase